MRRCLVPVLALLVSPAWSWAQTTGLPPFGSLDQVGLEIRNNQDLNILLTIPIMSSPGRGGLDLNFNVVYNSSVWRRSGSAWVRANGWSTIYSVGSTNFSTRTGHTRCSKTCPIGDGCQYIDTTTSDSYTYTDPMGTVHSFPLSYEEQYNECTGDDTFSGTFTGYATDGSGYLMNIDSTSGDILSLIAKNGFRITTPQMGPTRLTDLNGNYISSSTTGSETDWTDSAGRVALKVITGASSIQYEYLDPNDAYQTTTLNLAPVSVKTNFACSGVVEYTGTATLPSSIVLPNGQQYTFTYEQYPANSGNYDGRLEKVTLPTGGSYQYDYTGANDGINCADGTTLSLNRSVSDGTNSATWNYVRNTSNLTTTITTPKLVDTPSAFDTVVSFNSSAQEIERKIYPNSPGSGTPLRDVQTTWGTNGTPTAVVTKLEDGTTQSKIATVFDSNGLLDQECEFDFPSGTSYLRCTNFSYNTSSNYTSRNILDLVTSKVMFPNGPISYRQDITYDGVGPTLCPTGQPQHDDVNYPCTFNYRGNPTQVTTYLNPSVPSNGIAKNFTYDFFGNLLTAQLNCCQTKTWAYSAATQYSEPDSVTSGISPTQLTTSAAYYPDGQIETFTDENNLQTNFSYDTLSRPIQVSQSIGGTNVGGTVSYSYDDAAHTATTTTQIDATKSVQQITAVDALGRPNFSKIEDAANNVYSEVSTNYDLAGRAYQTSNPYTGGTIYWTTTQSDVLGRPISIALPDNSVTRYSYSANTATVTDPTGKQRKSVLDGVGRLSSVYEPDPANGNSLSLQTSYVYNVLDELTGVTQGSQTRSYVHDALGRLNSATTPEGGTVCFGTVSGGVCQSNGYDSFDNLLTKTDARGVVTSYGYDGLNRLTSISYNVSNAPGVPATASVGLTYGASAAQFNNGRLITMTDGPGSETYTYNNLGQLIQLQKVISGTTYTTGYGYNLANELTQIIYPSGRVVQQSVDPIGRLCEVAPTTTGCGTAATPYATGYSYNTASLVTQMKYGNGIYGSFGFSADRLQLTCLDYSTTNRSGNCAHDATSKFGLTYSYGAAGSNNGQISSISDYVQAGRSMAYTYDALYRMTNAATTGSASFPAWGLGESYDRYGNRQSQTVSSGCAGISCPTNSVSVSAVTNQLNQSPYLYDLSGNMTNDGLNTITYDGGGRAVTASGGLGSGTYTYDGNGLRVQKVAGGATSTYIFSGSKVIAEYNAWSPGITPVTNEYVYSGSALLARVGAVDVRFTNDSCSACGGNPQGGGDRNLFVTSMTLGSTVISPSDPSVSYTSSPCNGNGTLACSGDMVTVSAFGLSATTITVTAYGSPDFNIYPHMQLLVGGVVVGEWDVTGTSQDYTVTLPATATVAHYYHQDHLSNRLVTNSSGGVAAEMGHFPFGESWYNATGDKLYFTTYEYDSESGNYYAMARYHVSRLGRLSSPDPIAGSTANPQSLNRYSYSINDPANITDPSGALVGCPNTVETKPPIKSPQVSGDGPSDAEEEEGAGDDTADPPPQNGCGSRVNPFGGGLSLDGGFAMDDSGDMPNGGFQVGGNDLASEIALENVPVWWGPALFSENGDHFLGWVKISMLWQFGSPNNSSLDKAPGLPGFSKATFAKCAKQAFGKVSGSVPGTAQATIPGYGLALDEFQGGLLAGTDLATLGGTVALEHPTNSPYPVNTLEANGTMSFGPGNINSDNVSAPWIVPGTFGTNMGKGQVFNGDPVANLATAGRLLNSLGNNPGGYVGSGDLAAQRNANLAAIHSAFSAFFDCLSMYMQPMP